jgi:YggT family protein
LSAIAAILLDVAYYAVVLYIVILIVRFILDWVTVINPTWRPQGFLLVVAEGTFTMTDPPLKLFRRLIRPLVIGDLRLDFTWSLALLACFILLSLIQTIGALLTGVL